MLSDVLRSENPMLSDVLRSENPVQCAPLAKGLQ